MALWTQHYQRNPVGWRVRYGAIRPYQAFNLGLLGDSITAGSGRATAGSSGRSAGSSRAARHRHDGGRRDKPDQRPLHQARYRRSRGRRGGAAGHPARYTRRASGIDARHRGASAGVASPDGGIRLACRSAGRFGGNLHHRCRQLRGDGPRLQHRRGHSGLRHRPRPGGRRWPARWRTTRRP